MVLLESGLLGQFRVVNLLEQSLPSGSLDSPKFVESLRAGLRSLAGSTRDLSVWAGLATDRVRIHHLTLPKMKPRMLPQAVHWALQREELFTAEKTVLDFEVENEVIIDGKAQLHVTGFVIPKEDRDAMVEAFEKAGVPLTGLTLSLYGLRNLFRSEWVSNDEETRIGLHIGPQNSRIAIWSGGQSLLSRAIPVGDQQVAEELTHVLQPAPDQEEALRLVLELGRETEEESDHDSELIFRAVQPTLDRMARQIDRTLEYFRTQHQDRATANCIYITGAITGSPRCVEYLQSQVALPLQPIDPFDGEKVDQRSELPSERFERKTYATSFGLALSNESYTPNFLHTFKDRQQVHLHKQVNLRIFAFFFILAGLLGGFYAHQLSTLKQLQEEEQRAENLLRAQRPLATAADLRSQMASLRTDVRQLESQIDRQQAIALLASLSKLTPETVQLEMISTSLVASSDGKAKTASKPWIRLVGSIDGEPFRLETELALYARILESSPFFTEVKPNSYNLEERGRQGRLHFDLDVSLAPLTSLPNR